jgi:malonate-semialdehyde dehydrogenase (acetylating)/methylmalonate-semialdehyde dehydrogenase
MKMIGHSIGGRAVVGTSDRTAPVYDPARGAKTAEVALASAAEVDDAVNMAVEASAAWGDSSLSRRTAMLFRLRELLDAHRDGLAALVTAEHG